MIYATEYALWLYSTGKYGLSPLLQFSLVIVFDLTTTGTPFLGNSYWLIWFLNTPFFRFGPWFKDCHHSSSCLGLLFSGLCGFSSKISFFFLHLEGFLSSSFSVFLLRCSCLCTGTLQRSHSSVPPLCVPFSTAAIMPRSL